MRSSIRAAQVLESRDQSRRVGARSGGSFASSAPISSSVSPTRWAKTMKAMRRSTGARIAAVAGAGALGRDQPALLVEAERRGGDAAAPRHLADRQQVGHPANTLGLDFKLT